MPTSRFKGVHWCNRRNKWIAYAQHNKKCVYVGQYDSEEDAHNARTSFVPKHTTKVKIDVGNMQTCTAFTRSIDDY